MIVITGASDGLGLALAKLAVKKGETVVNLSRQEAPASGTQHIATDLTSEESLRAAAAKVLEYKEPLTALVHCAGIFSEEETSALTSENVSRTFATNTTGPLLLTSLLMERIKQDGADVAVVSSTSGLKGVPGQISYSASKWAIRGIAHTLQAELRDTSCRVVIFCPGGMRTGFFKKQNGQDFPDPHNWMDVQDVARFLLTILELPKSIEVSEVVVNRKKS